MRLAQHDDCMMRYATLRGISQRSPDTNLIVVTKPFPARGTVTVVDLRSHVNFFFQQYQIILDHIMVFRGPTQPLLEFGTP